MKILFFIFAFILYFCALLEGYLDYFITFTVFYWLVYLLGLFTTWRTKWWE